MDDRLSVPYYPVPYSHDCQGNYLSISGMDGVPLAQGDKVKNGTNSALTFEPQKDLDFTPWEDVLGNSVPGIQSGHFRPSVSACQPDTISFDPGRGNELLGQILTDGFGKQQEYGVYTHRQDEWKEQLFSIIDFSPNWAYVYSEVKVLITGKFLTSLQDLEKCNWSCMFGEVEVPAEVVADGVLRCHTPLQKAGRVPFYVTCSNRSCALRASAQGWQWQVSMIHGLTPLIRKAYLLFLVYDV